MSRAPWTQAGPSGDAAALLRRLGFAVLTVGLPVAALLSRRGIVVLLPIGVALLALAAVLDGRMRRATENAGRLLGSTGVVASGFVLVWAAASLLWSPAFATGSARLVTLSGTLAMAVAAYLALPDRMRAANLYLLPVGVALAAVVAIAMTVLGAPSLLDPEDDGRSHLMRGLSVAILFMWPALSWLRSRGRDLEAMCLGILVGVATAIGPSGATAMALAVGVAIFLLTTVRPTVGVAVTGAAMALAVAAAPALPFALERAAAALGHPAALAPEIGAWGRLLWTDPWRLLTGFGYGALLRGRATASLPGDVPDLVLLQIWFDLGVLGAVAVALSLWAASRASATRDLRLLPGITAAFATAFMLACLNGGTDQAWWYGAVALLALNCVAAERAQAVTHRPVARPVVAPLPTA